MQRYQALAGFLLALVLGTTQAQTATIDDLKQRMLDACPAMWEDMTSDIDSAVVTGDVWQADTADRDGFIQFMTTIMGADAPDSAGLNAMADDVSTVAAECATQRIGLLDGLLNKLPADVLTALTAVSEQVQLSGRLASYNHIGTVTGNYTVAPDDLASPLIVPIDISGGSVEVQELGLASMDGWARYVIVEDARDNSSNRAQLVDSEGNEIWTGFQKQDFVEIAYDGVGRRIMDEKATIEVDLRLISDDSVDSGQSAKVFDSNYSVERNIGGFWDDESTHRFNHPGVTNRMLFEVVINSLSNTQNLSVYPTHSRHGVFLDIPSLGVADGSVTSPAYIELRDGEHFEFEAYNGQAGARQVKGDPNMDESKAYIRLVRRVRIPEPAAIYADDFSDSAGSLSYIDDPFMDTNNPGYADGVYIDEWDLLRMDIGGNPPAPRATSGGWQFTLNLDEETPVNLAFRYKLVRDTSYENDEYSAVAVSVDGELVEHNGSPYVALLQDGNYDTGWQFASVDLGLMTVGTHTIVVGAYNNESTESAEVTIFRVDYFAVEKQP